jgi:hypothetical protein
MRLQARWSRSLGRAGHLLRPRSSLRIVSPQLGLEVRIVRRAPAIMLKVRRRSERTERHRMPEEPTQPLICVLVVRANSAIRSTEATRGSLFC